MENQQKPKPKMKLWKKILIGVGILFVIGIIGETFFPTNYYEEGMDYYNKQNYSKALKDFNQVKPSDENYNAAIDKIKEIKPIVDQQETNETATKNVEKNQKAEGEIKPPKSVNVGDILQTRYFNVTINKVSISDRINVGNEFLDVQPQQGNLFLIMNTTFKNIDNESRMIEDGIVYITYNGKEYTFDLPEPLMLEGWGLFFDQINPLTTTTTNLVYKIPAEIKGPAYYNPGRSSDKDLIFLGNL